METPAREPAAEVPPQRPRRKALWMAIAVLTAFVVIWPNGVQIWGRLIRTTHHNRIMSGPHDAALSDRFRR